MKYMNERVLEDKKLFSESLPVVTLSREYGCYASQIAKILSEELNKMKKKASIPEWQWISREILEKAAIELNQRPDDISHLFSAEKKGFLADIVTSFSKQYKSDNHIKNTITKIVKNYGDEGNVIIVGRAGCIITKDLTKTLHIKLIAPIEWRTKQISHRHKICKDEALKLVQENDLKRSTFMSFFKGNIPDSEVFDMILNRMTMNEKEIVHAIINVLQSRSYI